MCGTRHCVINRGFRFEIVEGAAEYEQRKHEENLHAAVTIAIDRGEHTLVQFEDIVPSL